MPLPQTKAVVSYKKTSKNLQIEGKDIRSATRTSIQTVPPHGHPTGNTSNQRIRSLSQTALTKTEYAWVNRWWSSFNPTELAAYVLWRINWIHPFVNGNGRTARAAAYFVICTQAKQWLGGDPILPELLRQEPNRTRYIGALKEVDLYGDLRPLVSIIEELLDLQLSSDPSGG